MKSKKLIHNETLRKALAKEPDPFKKKTLVEKASVIDAIIDGSDDYEQRFEAFAYDSNLSAEARLIHEIEMLEKTVDWEESNN